MSDEIKVIHAVINCSRINKARLFKKPDKPGSYLKVVIIKKKETDQWGNIQWMVKEDLSKEERDAGVEGNFIGDGKTYKPKPEAKPAASDPPTKRTKKPAGGLPF